MCGTWCGDMVCVRCMRGSDIGGEKVMRYKWRVGKGRGRGRIEGRELLPEPFCLSRPYNMHKDMCTSTCIDTTR